MSFDENESCLRSAMAGDVGPMRSTEAVVSDIWCDVLGISSVRPQDNFFDLGGHSVLLAMVSERVSKQFGREVSVLTMFAYPTVRTLAGHIDAVDHRSDAHAR